MLISMLISLFIHTSRGHQRACADGDGGGVTGTGLRAGAVAGRGAAAESF